MPSEKSVSWKSAAANRDCDIDTENLHVWRLESPIGEILCGIYGSKTNTKMPDTKTKEHRSSVGDKSGSAVDKKVEDTRTEIEIEEEWYSQPDFIYGGPFVPPHLPDSFLPIASPFGMPLSGTYKLSFAYYSLRERLPIILTKIIDYCSREGGHIKSANSGVTDEGIKKFIQGVAKVKSDLATNKYYEKFVVETPDAEKWNQWIDDLPQKRYYFNTWVWTECYVYRKIYETCQLTNTFDYFEEQKKVSFNDNILAICMIADKLVEMNVKEEEVDLDKRKADFITLLKLSLWSNKCDLSLSLGETTPCISPDPFQMILDYKDKLLVDNTPKIVGQVVTKAEKKFTQIENDKNKAKNMNKLKCSCERMAFNSGLPIHKPPEDPSASPDKAEEKKEEKKEVKKEPPPAAPAAATQTEESPAEEPPKPVPCPAKTNIPKAVYFDIVCDNAGYELFTDMCLAHFLVAQGIVQKVRFHVKNMPWFVSDATAKDFQFVINACKGASFTGTKPPPPPPPPPKGGKGKAPPPPPEPEPEAEPPPPEPVTSDNLKAVGEQWDKYVQDGVFEVMAEDYWTYPHCYKDMKKYDPDMYRKLQTAVAIVFKGDLNYRKLLGEKKCNPYVGLEPALQGFIPAPIIAIRTVKCDLICAMKKGKYEVMNKLDEKWMEKGEYGVIQYCAKAEPLKPTDRPCADYGTTCFGAVCPP